MKKSIVFLVTFLAWFFLWWVLFASPSNTIDNWAFETQSTRTNWAFRWLSKANQNIDKCPMMRCPSGTICEDSTCVSNSCGDWITDQYEECDSWTLCSNICKCPIWTVWCNWWCAEPGFCW